MGRVYERRESAYRPAVLVVHRSAPPAWPRCVLATPFSWGSAPNPALMAKLDPLLRYRYACEFTAKRRVHRRSGTPLFHFTPADRLPSFI
jgi:hypothetical protein